MIIAERDALHASVNHDRLAIRERELQNLQNYLSAVGGQASFIAGFVSSHIFTSLENTHPALKVCLYVSSCVSIGAMVYVIFNSELTTVYGTTMALVGPPGAMSAALTGMKDERKTIASCFGLGMAGFMGATLSAVFVHIAQNQEDLYIAIMMAFILSLFFGFTFRGAMRIRTRFPSEAGLNLKNISAEDFLSRTGTTGTTDEKRGGATLAKNPAREGADM